MSSKAPQSGDWPQAFGRAMQALRKTKGLSQEKFGFEVGLDRTYISGIERGVRNPSLKNIVKIAQALGVTPARAKFVMNVDRRAWKSRYRPRWSQYGMPARTRSALSILAVFLLLMLKSGRSVSLSPCSAIHCRTSSAKSGRNGTRSSRLRFECLGSIRITGGSASKSNELARSEPSDAQAREKGIGGEVLCIVS